MEVLSSRRKVEGDTCTKCILFGLKSLIVFYVMNSITCSSLARRWPHGSKLFLFTIASSIGRHLLIYAVTARYVLRSSSLRGITTLDNSDEDDAKELTESESLPNAR